MLIWGSSISHSLHLLSNYEGVSIRIFKDGINHGLLEKEKEPESLSKKKLIDLTAWNQERGIVENKSIGTSTNALILTVFGKMKSVCPMELVRGNFPYSEDEYGCIIDEDTAYKLFRDTNILGNEITYKQNKYYVRGIVKSDTPVLVVHSHDKKANYLNLELVFEDSQNVRDLTEYLMLSWGGYTSQNYTIVEGAFLAELSDVLWHFPAWVLAFAIIIECFMILWKNRYNLLNIAILTLLLVVVCATVRWLSQAYINIPERFLPTKWSDFEFWTRTYKTFIGQIEEIGYLLPVPKDMVLMKTLKGCFTSSLIATIFMFVLIIHKKLLVRKSLLKVSIAYILIVIMSMLLLFRSYGVFMPPRSYLVMIYVYISIQGLWFWLDYILKLFKGNWGVSKT